MHFKETFELLLAVTAGMIVLRSFWFRVPQRLEKSLLLGAFAVVMVRFYFFASQWSTVWVHFNALLCWLAVIGYEILLVRFSLMRPRWLTSLSSIILLLPMFGATLLFPLTGIFDTKPADIRSLSKNYQVQREPWDVEIGGRSGYDFGVFHKPSWAPFLRHLAQRSSFSDEQCQSDQVSISVDPAKKLVQFHCPARKDQQTSVDLTLPLK